MNAEQLKRLAIDLRHQPPPSPHVRLGGFVTAARSLLKCRAALLGINGPYNYPPCGLAHSLRAFTGITPDEFSRAS